MHGAKFSTKAQVRLGPWVRPVRLVRGAAEEAVSGEDLLPRQDRLTGAAEVPRHGRHIWRISTRWTVPSSATQTFTRLLLRRRERGSR